MAIVNKRSNEKPFEAYFKTLEIESATCKRKRLELKKSLEAKL